MICTVTDWPAAYPNPVVYEVTATVWRDRVVYEVKGPLGLRRVEGPREQFEAIRNEARTGAGLPPVSTSR
jgi:hypothetical protein